MELPDSLLEKYWINYDFEKAQKNLKEYQILLTKAVFQKRDDDVVRLSNRIVNSLDAKVLAVRKVSEELNSATGIDRVRWVSPAEKMRASMSLNPKDYKAKPFKHFVIRDEKANKERRINIPSMFDRAMQVLYLMALTPIAEATADRKSFAFRQGRSALDVHSLIMNALNEKDPPKYIVICDVKSYYDTISHEWILNNIPMDKKVLKEFLRAGFVFNNEIFPTDVGISLGCNISPTIGNMVLDGLQYRLYDLQEQDNVDYYDGYVIRFADDILIFARTKESADTFLKETTNFIEERGLKINQKKTYITTIEEGFDFLSRTYYKSYGFVRCVPSNKSIENFKHDLYDLILNNDKRRSQKKLIETLNAKLTGWAMYHRVSDAYEVFKNIDSYVSALLLNLIKKMYPKLPMKTLTKKYWYIDSKGREIFALPTNKSINVIKLEDVILVTHKRLDLKKNIYLDEGYFEDRTKTQDINKVVGKYKTIWNQQNGKCYYCGKTISANQPRKLVIKNITSKDKSLKNYAYIHSFCSDSEIVFVNSPYHDVEKVDIERVISEIKDPKVIHILAKKGKYSKLSEYFANCNKYTFCIKFSEIEKIIDNKLCNSLYKYESYWRLKGNGLISSCWLDNGYQIKRLYLKEKKVTFIRTKKISSKLSIPDELLGNLPDNAVNELNQFFDYIIKKYGL